VKHFANAISKPRAASFFAALVFACLTSNSTGILLNHETQVSTKPHSDAKPTASATGFVFRSPVVADGGKLPKDYTGDGTSSTLPLEWSGAPKGTKSFAVIMHHIAPDGIKWYWVLYDIPASVTKLPKNVKGVGTLGNNSINRKRAYAPPHSKGPGPKIYTYALYALSAPPKITVPPGKVSRAVLLAAMKHITLAGAKFSVVYTRFPAPERNRHRMDPAGNPGGPPPDGPDGPDGPGGPGGRG
jgi:phosphatidylethanolamine-binding protein (PEBP) family uncharacterized protein